MGKLDRFRDLEKPASKILRGPEKATRLQHLLSQAKQTAKAAPRRPASSETAYHMGNGWFNLGFPRPKVYRVEDLISYWRACVSLHFREKTPKYEYQFWMRAKLLKWLQEDGYRNCEAVVAYGVKMWEVLKDEFEIDEEYPTLGIVWGFRSIIHKRLQQTGRRRMGSGNTTDGYGEEQYREEVS